MSKRNIVWGWSSVQEFLTWCFGLAFVTWRVRVTGTVDASVIAVFGTCVGNSSLRRYLDNRLRNNGDDKK